MQKPLFGKKMSMRTFLERMSRRRSFVRHLPANLGGLPIIVSPDAQLKYLKPGPKGFDRTLLEAAVRLVRPGDNVWDVGANVGVFSVAAAALSLTGQIVAIEADIWLASLLSRTARLPANEGGHTGPHLDAGDDWMVMTRGFA